MNDGRFSPYRGAQQHRLFRKLGTVDVRPLNAQMAEQSYLWDAIPRRRIADGSPHGGMKDIWVRYNDHRPFAIRKDWTGFNDEHVPVWYPAWHALPALRPIVFGLMAATEAEMLCGVLLTRIPPGHGIDRHTDDSWHVHFTDKLYVCVASEPGAIFGAEDANGTEELSPLPGEVHLFDNRAPHWVRNASNADRITLIVCVRTEMFGRE